MTNQSTQLLGHKDYLTTTGQKKGLPMLLNKHSQRFNQSMRDNHMSTFYLYTVLFQKKHNKAKQP